MRERETGKDPPLGGGDGHNEQVVDLKPLSRQCTSDDRAVSQAPNTGKGNCPKPPSLVRPEQAEYTQDDNHIRVQPSLYVDYLSHDWKEEEVWASWKYIVSGKEGNGNSARLRNASWRAWMKSKYRLATVPAENINWLKDCDVTWLYGPLQGYSDRSSASYMALSGMGSSELDPLLNKKPTLKKRSALEVMLQLSLYNSSSLNPSLLRQGPGDEFLPVTPVANTKPQIRFHDKVEQFAVTDVGDYDGEDIEGPPTIEESVRRNTPIRHSQDDSQITSKTITILPSTTLKFQQDVPGLVEDMAQEGSDWLYLAGSQENLQSFAPVADILLNWDEECRDEGEAVVVPGLFSQVAGAVKAAKDIAFFLWITGYKN
ncbi:hypothetical protein BKA61DRAFT_703106 [Leptodontidium sp. MPI-SDFR-AT-0119]|nr:hypothetical protein BKA61DRAFT_703106 [Leptodontidium sp. MPI-SDFR-AT-0119]